jgi:hypothetical protein
LISVFVTEIAVGKEKQHFDKRAYFLYILLKKMKKKYILSNCLPFVYVKIALSSNNPPTFVPDI